MQTWQLADFARICHAHSVTVLYRNKPCSSFKPGQETLDRDYYSKATTEQADGAKCLQNYKRFGSDYANKLAGTVAPGDYKVPSKDANTLGKSS